MDGGEYSGSKRSRSASACLGSENTASIITAEIAVAIVCAGERIVTERRWWRLRAQRRYSWTGGPTWVVYATSGERPAGSDEHADTPLGLKRAVVHCANARRPGSLLLRSGCQGRPLFLFSRSKGKQMCAILCALFFTNCLHCM